MAKPRSTSPLVIVMGISGCGKSTLAAALSARLDWPYLEGDDYHSEANVAKMTRGEPLTNKDRRQWIAAIVDAVNQRGKAPLILSCSALNRAVRAWFHALKHHHPVWVHLSISKAEALRRVGARSDHFMPPSLIDSQVEALEPPADALVLSAGAPVTRNSAKVEEFLGEDRLV